MLSKHNHDNIIVFRTHGQDCVFKKDAIREEERKDIFTRRQIPSRDVSGKSYINWWRFGFGGLERHFSECYAKFVFIVNITLTEKLQYLIYKRT